MDNNYSPLLYFNEETSLEDSNKVALDESPEQIYAAQKDLKLKAKAHCDAIIEILNQLSDEVCYLYTIDIDITLYVILYYIQNMLNLLDEMKLVFCTGIIIDPSPSIASIPWTKKSRFTTRSQCYTQSSALLNTSSSSQAPPSPPYSFNTPSSKPFESMYNLRESTLLVCGIKRKEKG